MNQFVEGCGQCGNEEFCKQNRYCPCHRVPFVYAKDAEAAYDRDGWLERNTSDMTLSQMREARANAEKQIAEILLAFSRATGLIVEEVNLRTTSMSRLAANRCEVIGIEASIKIESP